VGAAIAIGAVVGLALGIVVSETTSVPLAPELGAVVGGLLGWLSRREREARSVTARRPNAPSTSWYSAELRSTMAMALCHSSTSVSVM
jgi:hypothetical protein